MSNNLPVARKENILKRIFKSLINKLKKNNPEVELKTPGENKKSNKEFRDSYKQEEIFIEPGSLDYAIDQFLISYEYYYQKTGKIDAYSSIIKLGAMGREEDTQNREIEKDVLDEIKSNPKFLLHTQEDNQNQPVFYHVSTINYEQAENLGMRIYINTKRKHVAMLVGNLLTELQDDNFYCKFSSDNQLDTLERSEAIVIYTDTINANNIINKIQKLENEQPDLFEGSENKNPFMKSIGSIAYAPDPESDIYIDKYNQPKKLEKSYNFFLSNALEESFVEASKEIIAEDKELTIKSNGEILDDPEFYLQYLDVIRDKHYGKFLNIMKKELYSAQERNSVLEINNINEYGKENENER